MVMPYQRVQVEGRSYLSCVVCRRPLTKGYRVCYLVGTPGNTPPNPQSKQALCGPHYIEQFVKTYGFKPEGAIPDNLLQVENVVSLQEELTALTEFQRGSGVGGLMDLDPFLLEQALMAAKSSEWGESVMSAYTRMQTEQDLDINEPITMDTDSGPLLLPTVQTLEEQIAEKQAELKIVQDRLAQKELIEHESTELRYKLAADLGCLPEDVDRVLKEKLGRNE